MQDDGDVRSLSTVLAAAPIGLLGLSVILDAAYVGAGSVPVAIGAFWLLSAGIAGAIATAPVWVMKPFEAGASPDAGVLASTNLLALMLFCASLGMRLASPEAVDAPGLPHGLSFLGAAMAVAAAWQEAAPARPQRKPRRASPARAWLRRLVPASHA